MTIDGVFFGLLDENNICADCITDGCWTVLD
jgi:hypothetical protein